MMTLSVWADVLGGGVDGGVAFYALSRQSKFLLVLLLVQASLVLTPAAPRFCATLSRNGPLSLAQAYSRHRHGEGGAGESGSDNRIFGAYEAQTFALPPDFKLHMKGRKDGRSEKGKEILTCSVGLQGEKPWPRTIYMYPRHFAQHGSRYITLHTATAIRTVYKLRYLHLGTARLRRDSRYCSCSVRLRRATTYLLLIMPQPLLLARYTIPDHEDASVGSQTPCIRSRVPWQDLTASPTRSPCPACFTTAHVGVSHVGFPRGFTRPLYTEHIYFVHRLALFVYRGHEPRWTSTVQCSTV